MIIHGSFTNTKIKMQQKLKALQQKMLQVNVSKHRLASVLNTAKELGLDLHDLQDWLNGKYDTPRQVSQKKYQNFSKARLAQRPPMALVYQNPDGSYRIVKEFVKTRASEIVGFRLGVQRLVLFRKARRMLYDDAKRFVASNGARLPTFKDVEMLHRESSTIAELYKFLTVRGVTQCRVVPGEYWTSQISTLNNFPKVFQFTQDKNLQKRTNTYLNKKSGVLLVVEG